MAQILFANRKASREKKFKTTLFDNCCINECYLNKFSANTSQKSTVLKTLHLCHDNLSVFDSKAEKMDYLRALLRNNVTRVTDHGVLKIDYKAGNISVCRNAFIALHGITQNCVEKLVTEIKSHVVASCVKPLNDKSPAVGSSLQVKRIVAVAKSFGINITAEQKGLLRLRNGDAALSSYAWMRTFFEMCGDHVPNSEEEIHLDPTHMKTIWLEHKKYMERIESRYLGYTGFCKQWASSFPHVSIRAYKGVSATCSPCSHLCNTRWNSQSMKVRELATHLHCLHRSMYMGERATYYGRRLQAKDDPTSYLSIIFDGMDQNHNHLPWLGNKKQWEPRFPQHLQGVLNHGRGITIYRTFANVEKTRNMVIQSIGLELERVIIDEGRLPDTLYWQIDGGGENANATVIAYAELIVIKNLCKKIVITRLPVGHTHEDIDAVFGVLWNGYKREFIMTPEEYKNTMLRLLTEKEPVQRVIDLFVVPDYEEAFKSCVGTFKRWAKTDWTQKQITIQKVQRRSELQYFPHDTKLTYRAYVQPKVVEIVKDDDPASKIGLKALYCFSIDHPRPEENPDRPVIGMHLLRSLPIGPLLPKSFPAGSKQDLDSVVAKMRRLYGAATNELSYIVHDWDRFVAEAPKSDDVREYIRENPMHVPLYDFLFSPVPLSAERAEAVLHRVDFSEAEDLEEVRATGSIIWDGTTLLNRQDGPRLVTSATDPTRVGTCPPPPPRSAAEMLKTGHQLIGYIIRKMFTIRNMEQVFTGKVIRYIPDKSDPELDLYLVHYEEDDDEEEMSHKELTALARPRAKANMAHKAAIAEASQADYAARKKGNKRVR